MDQVAHEDHTQTANPSFSADRAVMDVPKVGPLMGITAGLVWRGFETWSQISFRNRVRYLAAQRGQRMRTRLVAWVLPTLVAIVVHHMLRRRARELDPHNIAYPSALHPLPKPLLLQILVANDWERTKVFGRDTSRV